MTRILVRALRLPLLLIAGLTWLLGAGVARYLGNQLDAGVFLLGLIWSLLLLMAAFWLQEFFRPDEDPLGGDPPTRRVLLLAFSTALAVLAALGVLMMSFGWLSPQAGVVMGLALLCGLGYGLPPLRLSARGFGELTVAILLADLFPMFSFLLQADEVHRLLLAVILPLTLIGLAALVALAFSEYAGDLAAGRQGLLIRIGWRRALPLHHILALSAFILLAAGPVMGFSLALFWPAMLTLPLAVIEIVWLNRISLGAPPVWNFLNTLAMSFFGMSAYLLALTFWLR